MRILYLAHRTPYPPNKGDKIRSYHHVRHLAQRHEVHLLSFADEPAPNDAGWDTLRAMCASVELIPLSRKPALARGVVSLARGRSLSEGYFGGGAMRRAVARRCAQHAFDVAWAFSSTMAQYLAAAGARHSVADFVDVDSEKWRQYGEDSRGPLRVAYALEARRLRAFETLIGEQADAVLLISADEAALMHAFCPRARLTVAPNGVDTAYFRPSPAPPPATPTVLFTGALDYPPNVQAVLFAIREIMPLIRRQVPAARLIAAGHRPTAELLAEAGRQPALHVAGSVPDIRPYFAEAAVYIAPLRVARGVQNKLLEAMAMRVPVVASPGALVGLAARPGEHALMCGSAEEFAAAVCGLLRDPTRRQSLVDRAARLVAERYEWPANLALLDACLAAPAGHDRGMAQTAPAAANVDRSPSCSHA